MHITGIIAQDAGYSVSTTPKNHVVFEAGQSGASGLYGHVAFVEKSMMMDQSLFQNQM